MLKTAFLIVALSLIIRIYLDFKFTHQTPTFVQDDYFGEGAIQADEKEVSEYTLEVSNDAIEKMKLKLASDIDSLVPIVEAEDGKPHECPETEYVNDISMHFKDFNWNQHQYFINTFQQYRVEIEGLRIHFARVSFQNTYKTMIPLILLHDWTTSFWSFYKVIPIFSNPNRFGFDFGVKRQIAFDVIVPSIPGIGFSDVSRKSGFGLIESARILCKLIGRLSIQEKVFVHGNGQFGTSLATTMSLVCPTEIRGLHLLNPSLSTFVTSQTHIADTIADLLGFITDENYTAISAVHADNLFKVWPESQQIAYANSLLGTMALVLREWAVGTDPNHSSNSVKHLHEFFTVDELLTNTVICWITQTIPRSLRLFKNTALNPISEKMFRASVSTPTAILIAPDAAVNSEPEVYSKRYFNVTQFNRAESGGNYYALQKPQKFAEDVFLFVESIAG